MTVEVCTDYEDDDRERLYQEALAKLAKAEQLVKETEKRMKVLQADFDRLIIAELKLHRYEFQKLMSEVQYSYLPNSIDRNRRV